MPQELVFVYNRLQNKAYTIHRNVINMPSPLHPRFLAEYIGPSPIIIEAGAADGTGNATAGIIPRPETAGVIPRPVTAGVIPRAG